ncbi:MAG: DUF1573 domain-containing protein [Desulfobacteraceae bacterium]|nr:DUF1573 domain-containing protein [Desulfobacteraceae bacterium]
MVKGNDINGFVQLDADVFSIKALGNGLHLVIRQDFGRLPADSPALKPDDSGMTVREERQNNTRSDDGTEITVMVAYTSAAAKLSGMLPQKLKLMIEQTNTAYQNSQITPRLRLVHVVQVSYSESLGKEGFGKALDNFTDKDGYMDEIHTLRDTYAADICVLLINNNTYCGLGWLNLYLSSENGFAVVDARCTRNYSFAHELGHVQAADHNPEASYPPATDILYAHGYLNPQQCWNTIMAYQGKYANCPGGYTFRIPYFSNPNVLYKGVETGTPLTHNNARVLNETAMSVANFRSSQPDSSKFVIRNAGNGPLTVSSVTKGQNWLTLSGYPTVPFTIAPGNSQTVTVSVNWSLVGTATQGNIQITSNDPDESSVNVKVGVLRTSASEIIVPIISAFPGYSEVPPSSGSGTLTIRNIGSGAMNWTAQTMDSWLTITSGNSGTDEGTIYFNYLANTGNDPRDGNITITAQGAQNSPLVVKIRQLSKVLGDVNNDGSVNLADVIKALQVLAGLTNLGDINLKADVNGDGKIGLQEVIYILQKVAGLREETMTNM